MSVLQCNVCGFCAVAEIGVGCKSTKNPPCFGRMFIEPQLMDADWRCAPDSPEQDAFIDRCIADALHSLQSQLEQLRAENERLRGDLEKESHIADDYAVEADNFRSRAIQLCKDKAAECEALLARTEGPAFEDIHAQAERR